MATFAELVADVKILTNRPDLDTEIKLAVKAATLKAHHTDFYPKDLFETGIQWSPVAFTQSLTYRGLIPRYRSLKYLRKLDSTGLIPGIFFRVITPDESLAQDAYYTDKENVCYLAGEDLEIKSSTEDTYMIIGCYLHPDITEATYNSWIAVDHPFCIEYEATSKIFKQIGFDEQAAAFNKEVAEQFMILRNAEVLAQGY